MPASLLLFLLTTLPHIPPALHLHLHVYEERAELEVLVWADVYREWAEGDALEDGALSPEAWRAARAARFRDALAATLVLEIDGIEVLAEPLDYRYQPGSPATDYLPYALVRCGLETKGRARSIAVRIRDFEPVLRRGTSRVPLLHDEGADTELGWVHLDELEPSFIWHSKPKASTAARTWTAPVIPRLWLPLASLAVVGLALVGLAIPSIARLGPRSILVSGAVLSIALFPFARAEVDQPIFRPQIPPLTAEDAERLFLDLHRNIYRAFDHDEEVLIYDTLARSVGRELLESIYHRVYEELLLRDEGGARSKVRTITVLSTEFDLDPTAASVFHVVATWRVQGAVSHDGHTHTRTLHCEARYTLGRAEDGWKIRSEEVIGTRREAEDIPAFGIEGSAPR